MRCRLDERKIVARAADRQHRADAELVMHEARAAAARRLAFDAEHVTIAPLLGVRDRILPDQAVRQMQIDVGAGGETGNRRSRYRAELVKMHPLGGIAYPRQPHGDRRGGGNLVETHR